MLVITLFCIIGMVVLDQNKIVCDDLSSDSNKISKAEGIVSKNAFHDRKNVTMFRNFNCFLFYKIYKL
jgi:hypothetical protein